MMPAPYCRDGDAPFYLEDCILVPDPSTGSSTTGPAACAAGGRFTVTDREQEFCDLSIARFRNSCSGKPAATHRFRREGNG